ncbi:MAG: ankyrin repeat domain-containing protein [Bacteroidota bacterium]
MRFFLLAALALTISTTAARAQGPCAGVDISTYAPEIRVDLHDAHQWDAGDTATPTYTQVADQDGNARFEYLDVGDYVVLASLNDYHATPARFSCLSATRSRLHLDVRRVPSTAATRSPDCPRLHEAETAEHVRCAIDAGADVNAPVPNEGGATPLHIAAGWDRAEVVRALLDAGAEMEARDEGGMTPLLSAADGPGTEALRLLLNAGADPLVTATDFEGNGAMHYAVRVENAEAIQFLTEAGVPVDQRAGEGMTALMQAVGYGGRSLETVRLLLRLGASVIATDDSGDTPLHWTARWDGTDAARILLEAGADPNAVAERFGYTPLHTAFLFSTEAALVPLLLEAGADPRAVTADGRTVLDTAEEMADSEYADQAAARAVLQSALAE